MNPRLLHHSAKPLDVLIRPFWPAGAFKPRGFWVSVEGPHDWRSWCEAEGWATDRFAHTYEVALKPDADVLWVRGEAEFDAFDAEWGYCFAGGSSRDIRWIDLEKRHAGLIIAPYLFSRRMGPIWYYGWDCASGCIWDVGAIQATRLVEATIA